MTRMVPMIALLALLAVPSYSFAAEPEDEIRELVVDFNDAYLENDLAVYFGYYAEDATLWFNSGRTTVPSYRESWYKLIEAGGGVRENTISDITIQMSPDGDAAIATYQVDVATQSPGGSISSTHAHETDVWFRTGDGWRVAHVHYTAERGDE